MYIYIKIVNNHMDMFQYKNALIDRSAQSFLAFPTENGIPHLLEAAQQGTQRVALRCPVRLLLPTEEPALGRCSFPMQKMVVLHYKK